jgi:3-deoxy-D-manno-octulosonic-acid transferase
MTLFFYNLLLLAVLILGAPWWLFRLATTRKYRDGLLQRLGLLSTGVSSPRPVLWIHAVSVGEVIAIGWLVKRLDETLPGYQIVVSTTTRTGQALARDRFGAGRVFYCPLDLPWAVGRVLNDLNPKMLILAETEFWPNLLTACKRRGIPVAVVNARISDRSWPRYKALSRLWRRILSGLALVHAQTEMDAGRLIAIGCRSERVQVGGNLKFDVRTARQSDATRLLRVGAESKRVIVAGSTLDGEEADLIAAFSALLADRPDLLLVLAPRHPERFNAVAALLARSELNWQRRSHWQPYQPAPPEQLGDTHILLLDSIGELADVYRLAYLAFVGGSLVPAGGHNPLEPAQFGIPILIGPSFENFRGIVEPMLAAGGIRIVDSQEHLKSSMAELLTYPERAKQMGHQARLVFESQAGATERTVKAIQNLIHSRSSANEGSQ